MDVSPEMVRSAQAAMKEMDSETLSQMASLAEKLNKIDQKDGSVQHPVHPHVKPSDIQSVREMCEVSLLSPQMQLVKCIGVGFVAEASRLCEGRSKEDVTDVTRGVR